METQLWREQQFAITLISRLFTAPSSPSMRVFGFWVEELTQAQAEDANLI